ncbi:hypothetical protein M2403_003323 [Rahnella sp. BIGb0603]|nr:hypothetical protein [Rahnella sp. BIGb0603]
MFASDRQHKSLIKRKPLPAKIAKVVIATQAQATEITD